MTHLICCCLPLLGFDSTCSNTNFPIRLTTGNKNLGALTLIFFTTLEHPRGYLGIMRNHSLIKPLLSLHNLSQNDNISYHFESKLMETPGRINMAKACMSGTCSTWGTLLGSQYHGSTQELQRTRAPPFKDERRVGRGQRDESTEGHSALSSGTADWEHCPRECVLHPSSPKQSLGASAGVPACNLPRPPQKCNASRARCPTSSLRVSMQLTLSPAASHMGHTQLSLPQAWPTSPRGPSQGHQRAPGAPATGDGRSPGGGPGRRTHRRGGRARRGCPCPRRRGWVRRPLARAVRGARLRARAAGSAVQSARACRLARRAARPGSRLPGGASRRAPPERLPGALPGRGCRGSPSWRLSPRPRPAPRRRPSSLRVPTPKIASPAAVSHPARSPATPSRRAGISLIGK